MKTVVFQADAEAEMIEAAAYYEAQQCDLGRRFLASVQDSINRKNPRSELGTRTATLHKDGIQKLREKWKYRF